MTDTAAPTPATGFYLYCTGQIESCEMSSCDNLYCKYTFEHSSDWKFLQGLDNGLSQIARTDGADHGFLFNYPIDVTFKASNAHGWPKLVISCYTLNFFGTDVVKGYGWVHLPTVPGRHVRYVRLYTPRATSMCSRLTSVLTGVHPEYFDSKFVAQNRGREVTRVQSAGVVKITFNCMMKNMNSFGYSTNDQQGKLMVNASIPAAIPSAARELSGGEKKSK